MIVKIVNNMVVVIFFVMVMVLVFLFFKLLEFLRVGKRCKLLYVLLCYILFIFGLIYIFVMFIYTVIWLLFVFLIYDGELVEWDNKYKIFFDNLIICLFIW